MTLPLPFGADQCGAVFSPCRTWRYRLWRTWNPGKSYAMFLMLNPSTADELTNDPTVARCQQYALRWGYGGLYVCNLFAYRATDPDDMKTAPDPVGPENDSAILETAMAAGAVVCAWGNHGAYQNRAAVVVDILRQSGVTLRCLRVTKAGAPQHPLYLRSDLTPIPMPSCSA